MLHHMRYSRWSPIKQEIRNKNVIEPFHVGIRWVRDHMYEDLRHHYRLNECSQSSSGRVVAGLLWGIKKSKRWVIMVPSASIWHFGAKTYRNWPSNRRWRQTRQQTKMLASTYWHWTCGLYDLVDWFGTKYSSSSEMNQKQFLRSSLNICYLSVD